MSVRDIVRRNLQTALGERPQLPTDAPAPKPSRLREIVRRSVGLGPSEQVRLPSVREIVNRGLTARDGNTGQISLGPSTKRLSPGEAGFRRDGGIPGLSCGDCGHFVGGGPRGPECLQVDIRPAPADYCNEFTTPLSAGHRPSGNTLTAMSQPAHLDLFITRVAAPTPGDQRKRWYATSSGVKRDAYGEWMTLDLFRDFIRRAQANEPAPEPFASRAWKGGLPYLGVAHYLDMDGFGIAGDTDKVYIDGSFLRARGTFRDTPLAEAAYRTIKRDIESDLPPDQRTRISIAFVDWSHDHGPHGTFTRRSMLDHCELCERGAGEKHYRAGQLVHLALTRMPAYADTEIALEGP